MKKRDDVKLYSLCFSKKDYEFPDNEIITPLQVGADVNPDDVCELKDNTGDNISNKNWFYMETSGMYWIWKNIHGCKYKGQMQYRRPLVGIDESTDFDDLFSEYDVITCKPYVYTEHNDPKDKESYFIPASTLVGGYKFSHCVYDLLIVQYIIEKWYPEYVDTWDEVIREGDKLYYSNGFILKEADYDKYCEFLFDILGKWLELMGVDCKEDLFFHVGLNFGRGYYRYSEQFKDRFNVPAKLTHYQSEIGGFLSERIWTLYLLHNFKKDKILELEYKKMEEKMRI